MFKKYKLSHYLVSFMLAMRLWRPWLRLISMVLVGQHLQCMRPAKQFKKNTGIEVNVTAGPTPQWAEKAKLDADIIYSGSEAMMSDFESVFSEQIIKNSVEPLYLRPAAILVRKGNPKED